RTNTTPNITLASGGTGYFRGNITSTATITGGALTGATITGGTIQTAASGARAVMSGSGFVIYPIGEYGASAIEWNYYNTIIASIGVRAAAGVYYGTYIDTKGGILECTGNFSANGNLEGTSLSIGSAAQFKVNTSGQITKVNNISPTAKYTLIGDGTSFTPRLLAMSDLPAITASKVLVSDGSGYVAASAVSNTTLDYLDATSSIQTQLNAKQAAYTNLTSIGSLTNASGWLKNNGSGTFSYSTPSATDVGLGSVQNFAPSYGDFTHNWSTDVIYYSASNTWYGWTGTISGGHLSNTTFTDDNTNGDYLTITNAGVYRIDYVMNYYATYISGNIEIGFGVSVDNATPSQAFAYAVISDTYLHNTSGGTGFVTISAGQTVRLKSYVVDNTKITSINIVGSYFNITKISN
ncbi:MAG: hypothetical protein ACYC56_10560, partial [Candidatus Aquicultor sp.]